MQFLIKPFQFMEFDVAAVLIAGVVMVGAGYLFLRTPQSNPATHWSSSAAYIAFTGVAIFLLGMFP